MTYLPWLMSAITIYMTVLAGNKNKYAWAVGLLNQALWLTWIVATANWGFLPMNIALWIVYGETISSGTQQKHKSTKAREPKP